MSDDELKAEIRRWMGGVLAMMGPKISTDAYNALTEARDNLNAILDHPTAAAVAATPRE
jgi:hypothetical protein